MNRNLLLLYVFFLFSFLLTIVHAACKFLPSSSACSALYTPAFPVSSYWRPLNLSHYLLYPLCPWSFSIVFLFHTHSASLLLTTSLNLHIQTASATSFCKCICFNNSTIIALNPPPDKSSGHPTLKASSSSSSSSHLTCASCNRAFCLSYKLPICANAKEEDVFATCFQRDSVKDEAVVFIFIFTTAGLLGWAVLKPWVVKWTGWGGEKRVSSLGRGGRGGGPGAGEREREGRYVPLVGESQAEGSELRGERNG